MADLPDGINDSSSDDNDSVVNNVEAKVGPESDSSLDFDLQLITDAFASFEFDHLTDEFVPSSDSSSDRNDDRLGYFPPIMWLGSYMHVIDNHRRRNKHSQGRRRLNGRESKAQREDKIKRTVYVSDIDHNVTEDQLATLFRAYGQVLDCRICGDQHSRLRFAFVEFADKSSARSALKLCGIMLGFSQIMVLPSKTAILPVNPTFYPKSEDEKEMCARTVYCTNIDNKVSQDEVKNFFEARCGKVSNIRLSGEHARSRIAFVEFMTAENAIMALHSSGQTLGTRPIRVSPSKTPVRGRVARSPTN